MLKMFSVRKILIASLLLLVALIIYSFPEQLEADIDNIEYDSINIYLIDRNNYVAMTSVITKGNDFDARLKTIIKSLTVGSDNTPKNFTSVIPRDTKLLGYSINDGLLKIDFSKQLLNVTYDEENRMLESLIYSLTSLEEVKKIMLFVEGSRLTELPNSHKKLDLYLDRSYGVNKIVDIDSFKETQLVTVYYLGTNDSYVPISYVTNGDEEKIEIIVNKLRSNKMNSSLLSSHLNYQVQLMNYEQKDNEFFLNFNSVLLNSVYDGKLKEEVKYALSYSIYDTYGIENVVFQVDSNKIDELRLAK